MSRSYDISLDEKTLDELRDRMGELHGIYDNILYERMSPEMLADELRSINRLIDLLDEASLAL